MSHWETKIILRTQSCKTILKQLMPSFKCMQSFVLLNFVTSFSQGWKAADVECTKRNVFTKQRATVTIISGNHYFACAFISKYVTV